MFKKGHKNKKIHLLRLAVMAASLSVCLFGCSGLHAVKNRGRSAEMDTDSLVVYSPHPLDFINPIVSEFESQTGIPVQVRTGCRSARTSRWSRTAAAPRSAISALVWSRISSSSWGMIIRTTPCSSARVSSAARFWATAAFRNTA